jgi:hypothetical protein
MQGLRILAISTSVPLRGEDTPGSIRNLRVCNQLLTPVVNGVLSLDVGPADITINK